MDDPRGDGSVTQFVDAVRTNSRILMGLSGPTGSGKTYSALRVATGLADGGTIAYIDTERGRALDYADTFQFKYAELDEPFTPQRYIDALDMAESLNPSVVIVDSASHEHAGIGGVLDMHEAELQRMAGDDYKKREAMKFAAWVAPKEADKKYVSRLTRMRCHLIVCLRAEDKIDLVKNPETGKLEVKPKRTLSGHVGWIPVSGKTLPYELTLSLVVTPDAPGKPHPIKLPEPLKPFVPLDQPLSEATGKSLAEWARGGSAPKPAEEKADPEIEPLRVLLVDLATQLEADDAFHATIAEKADAGDKRWLKTAIGRAEKKLEGAAA